MNSNPYKRKCCICKKPIEGTGHNPIPVWPTGRCCDKCHSTYVLPARYRLIAQQAEEEKTEQEETDKTNQ